VRAAPCHCGTSIRVNLLIGRGFAVFLSVLISFLISPVVLIQIANVFRLNYNISLNFSFVHRAIQPTPMQHRITHLEIGSAHFPNSLIDVGENI
jgi:hypothetical protein